MDLPTASPPARIQRAAQDNTASPIPGGRRPADNRRHGSPILRSKGHTRAPDSGPCPTTQRRGRIGLHRARLVYQVGPAETSVVMIHSLAAGCVLHIYINHVVSPAKPSHAPMAESAQATDVWEVVRLRRVVMRRMRRIRRYHAQPPHNTPRESPGPDRKSLILSPMLCREQFGGGCYAAVRASIYS